MKNIAFIFTDIPQVNGKIVAVPADIRSKTMLLEILGAALDFPDYYGVNWDAFEECVRDLSWVSEYNITIQHVDFPLACDVLAAKTYLTILMNAVEKWANESTHRLMVIFPSNLQAKVESLVEHGDT